jgi:hypothetical protein
MEDRIMMTLLRGFHSIAAQRGDGLRPELLEMITRSPAWSGLAKLGEVTSFEEGNEKEGGENSQRPIEPQIIKLPTRKLRKSGA